MSGQIFFESRRKIEMDVAAADGAADLCIDRAQVAMLVMRQRLVLRLFGQRMRDAVRDRALLGEQQGEDEAQRQKQAKRSHDGVTLTKAGEVGKLCGGIAVNAPRCVWLRDEGRCGLASRDHGNGGKPLARNSALAAVLLKSVEVDVEVEAGLYDPDISFPR